jgi:hypothetical protein
MSTRPVTLDVPVDEWSPVQWAVHVWSWIFLLVQFVALELWVDPLMASLVLCLKLGWRDTAVAMRLRRELPHGAAKALGRFCIAMACVKVACAGVLLTVAVVVFEMLVGVQPQIGRFLAGFVMLVLGLGFAELALLFGAAASLTHNVRPWLDATIYENLFKPDVPLRCHGKRNRLRWLLVLGMFLVSITFLSSPILAIAILLTLGNPLAIPGGIVFTIFWYFTFRAMHAGFANLAKTAEECWQTDA